ncbi:uncharacterized protein FIBRA_04170 [Fibroporia radiculosa]|uniref:Vacuolar import and degradation protein-domain-containing protein n=1 Tax=Fibroporia radiculosa TaxID=599839 RepID=J4G6Y2_9APHY|nr:uncharacterized protein FIBRA_04170 [Fibroporia radiculosa]CCM02093.1 predicted protein [Fibroporia radiculosa]
MPSEHPLPPAHDLQPQEQPQGQIKLCSACHCPLSADSPNTPFLLHDSVDSSDTSIVCGPCRARFLPPSGLYADMERELLRRAASLQDDRNEASALHQDTLNHAIRSAHPSCPDADANMDIPSHPPPSATSDPIVLLALPAAQAPSFVSSGRPLVPPIDTKSLIRSQVSRTSHPTQTLASSLASASRNKSRAKAPEDTYPDPLLDITHLRVRSQGHHCLYPGATFKGTQKSGRNSYDVNVTIVDVDFSSSHLCGYLRIRGLTDDWPELTTYFDAQIIGSRYGFLTQNWGASEQEDMVHWARFPAFRHVKPELKRPNLTMNDANRGAVFMRWKEKFLVPDHRVQDINGASFAGFYYVCVDFNPQQSACTQPLASPETLAQPSSPQAAIKPELSPRARRTSTTQGTRQMSLAQSRGFPAVPVATMSGFYYHQNSEP